MSTHYKIVNTTKWAGEKKGPHKNGFFVSVVKNRMMGVGRHIMVEKITPGMLAQQRKGNISIQEVGDINLEIKKEVAHLEKQNEQKRKVQEKSLKTEATIKANATKDAAKKAQEEADKLKQESVVESSLDKQAMKDLAKQSIEHNAVVSGDGIESGKDPLGDVEEAISPDGEPNFVVTAGKKSKGNKNKNKRK